MLRKHTGKVVSGAERPEPPKSTDAAFTASNAEQIALFPPAATSPLAGWRGRKNADTTEHRQFHPLIFRKTHALIRKLARPARQALRLVRNAWIFDNNIGMGAWPYS